MDLSERLQHLRVDFNSDRVVATWPLAFSCDAQNMTHAWQDSESIDDELEAHDLVGHLGCGYWSEDESDWKTDGTVIGGVKMEPGRDVALVECDTFHLSAFTSRRDSTTPEWSTADLLTDLRIFKEVGREISSAKY